MRKYFLLLILILPIMSSAQSAGYISGVVKDSITAEVLPGVTLKVQGQSNEVQTDDSGFYKILDLPAGQYTLQIEYYGYKTIRIEGVKVYDNTNTRWDIKLVEGEVKIEAVAIAARDSSLFAKTDQGFYSIGSAEFLSTTPIKGFENILDIFPAVVIQDANVHIRGGRNEETAYFVDGSYAANPIDNTNALYVIQDATEEIQVLSAGFSAEFGGATSAIITRELKTGGSDYAFSLDFQTDNFADKGKKFLNTYSYNDNFFTLTASGPVVTDNLRFFAAYEYTSIGDTKKRFSTGYQFNNIIDAGFYSTDTFSVSYPDGFTPGNELQRNAFNATLIYNFNPFQVKVSALYDSKKEYSTNQPMLEIFNTRDQYEKANTSLISTAFSHTINPHNYYDLKFTYFNAKTELMDDWFGNNWRSWADSAKVSDYTDGEVTYRSAFRDWSGWYGYELNGFLFSRNGTLESDYYKVDNQYYSFSGAYVSQFNGHQLKAGFDYRKHTLRRFKINPEVMSTINFAAGERERDVNSVRWQEFLGNTYGYDYYGYKLNTGFNKAKRPVFGAVYIQDKITFSDIIFNAGLRFDYFDTKDRTLKNPTNPLVDHNTYYNLDKKAWQDLKVVKKVSPRMGASFAANANTVFYVTYGKYLQMPELDDTYFADYQYYRQIVWGWHFYTNPIGYGLKPIYSTLYKLGLNKQLGEKLIFNMSVFYKDIKGQPEVARIIADPLSEITNFSYIRNGAFSNSKGMHIQLQFKGSRNLNLLSNYTFTSARGTGSDKVSYLSTIDRNGPFLSLLRPLDFVQKHRGSVILDYRFGKDEGGYLFEQFGANLLFRFNSGHPFTLAYSPPGGSVSAYDVGVDYMLDTRSREPLQPINSSSTPWVYYTDLRLDKGFNITEEINATVYMRVTNLFNRKNVINVYEVTGSANDDGFLSDPQRSQNFINWLGAGYVEMYKAININNGQAYLDKLGKELYGHPRQIMFGFKLTY